MRFRACVLAQLLEEGDHGPHLIVAPMSTVENWMRELQTWWAIRIALAFKPSILCYLPFAELACSIHIEPATLLCSFTHHYTTIHP